MAPEHTGNSLTSPAKKKKPVTFSEIADRSGRLAGALTELGLKRGDRVLVILPRVVPWWETLVGLFKAGIVAIPGTTLLTAKDLGLSARAGSSGGRRSPTAEGAEKIDAIAASTPASCGTAYSSARANVPAGTRYDELIAAQAEADRSRSPRVRRAGARLFHLGHDRHAEDGAAHACQLRPGPPVTGRFWLDLRPEDLHWNVSDTGWAKAAWSSLFGPWIAGRVCSFITRRANSSRPTCSTCLARYPITTLCAAPTIYRWLVQLDLRNFGPWPCGTAWRRASPSIPK